MYPAVRQNKFYEENAEKRTFQEGLQMNSTTLHFFKISNECDSDDEDCPLIEFLNAIHNSETIF